MASIDERVVSMVFENAKFEAGVAQTMATLGKLDAALTNIGQKNGLDNIEKAASKVTLEQPMSALDKLKARFSHASDGAAEGFSQVEKAGSKVTLEAPITALNKVQAATANVGAQAADGFNEIERASSRVSLQGLNAAMDSVTAKFSTLQAAASVALGGITAQATQKGLGFAKSFSFGPINDGLQEYQTNLQAIQTVQANTDQPLTKINDSLNQLNHYSDLTIYNFGEMAKNIGTFTAAGVDLKTATSSIKGIANMAALSGSSSQQASVAMYQLSQAIASGKVGLQDWNSVVNAGMGGKKLQTALATTATAMGTIGQGSIKMEGPLKKLTIDGQSFRESIMAKPGSKPWLTSDVLVNTLATLDGRFSKMALSQEKTKDGLTKYTKAQIEAKIADNRAALEKKNGVKYTDAQFKSLMHLSDSAFESATQVKTLGQVFDVAKEAIGSGWSSSFQSIFGDLNEAKKLFTGMSNSINGFINASALARNNVLHDWKALGGRTALIDGIKTAFKDLGAILKPIGQAFRDVFPRKSGQDLATMTKHFADLMHELKPSPQQVEGLRSTFRGLFAVLHIGWSIVKGVVGVIGDLLGVVGKGSGGFLTFTGGIGDFLVGIDKALTKGGLLTAFFKGLSGVIRAPITLLGKLADAIAGLFRPSGKGMTAQDHLQELNQYGKVLTPLERIVNGLKDAWEKLTGAFSKTKQALEPFFSLFVDKLKGFGDAITSAFKGANFDKTMSVLQTGFIGGIFLALRKGITGTGSEFVGILKPLNSVLGQLSNNLKTMQQAVKAKIILEIATAIGILSVSVLALSKIDAKDLAKSMTAIAIGLGELMGSIKLMTGGLGKLGFVQLPLIAGSLILLATALVILAGAMKIFATMSWGELVKGLAGVGGGLTAIALGMKFMDGPQLLVAAPALIAIGIALNLLALAMKQMASLSWEELARGLAGVLGGLVAMIAPITAAGPEIAVGALGVVAISFALNMLAGAIKLFSDIQYPDMIRGLVGASAALVAIGLAIQTVPPDAILMAAGLVVVGLALTGIAGAVKIFGSMDVGTLAKGLIAMGGALLILAVGLTAMSGTLPGAAALLVAAGGLAILAPALAFLGTLKWGTIFKGLGAIALALGTLAIAGMLAAPGLAELGLALIPLGLAMAVAAAAAYLFAKALSLLGENGAKGITVMVAAITAFLALLPKIIITFVQGLVDTIAQIAKIAPQVVDALAKILDAIINVVIKETPRLATAIGTLVDGILQVIIRDSPKLIRAGWTLIQNLLKGLDDNLPTIIPRVGSIIGKFVLGLAQQAPMLIAAGAKLIITVLNGVASHISDVVQAAYKIEAAFIEGLGKALPKILAAGVKLVTNLLSGIASAIPKLIHAGVHIITSLLDGISSQFDDVAAAATRFVVRFFNAFGNKDNVRRMVHAGVMAVLHILEGVAQGLRQDDAISRIVKAALDIGKAVADGIIDGVKDLPERLIKKLVGPVKGAYDAVNKFIKPGSPSKLFTALAATIPTGFAKGLDPLPKTLDKHMLDPLSKAVSKAFKILDSHSPSKVFQALGESVGQGMAIGLVSLDGVLTSGMVDPFRAALKATGDLRTFGKYLGTEFKDGLTGGLFPDDKNAATKQIEDTFTNLKLKMTEEHKKLAAKIKEDQDKLKGLLDDPKKNAAEIAQVRAAIESNQQILALSQFRSRGLLDSMAKEQAALIDMGNKYQFVTAWLDSAKQSLDQLRSDRDSFINSTAQQFNTLPDISSIIDNAMSEAAMSAEERADAAKKKADDDRKRANIDQVALYKKTLADQIAATQKYMDTLGKLRAAGLDDATYKKLLEMGTAGQEFASQLLGKGAGGIAEINKLDGQLAAASTKLAVQAGLQMFQAGVDAAAGLVKGLTDKQAEIRKTMEDIAKTVVDAIRKQLGIRSPSRVLAEIGKNTVQGMAEGIKANSGQVSDAAASVGDSAAKALTKSLSNVSDQVQNGIDTDVTITPVLDLTEVQKGASKIQDLTNVTPITAAASYGQASAISQATQANTDAQPDPNAPAKVVEVKFEQNNTSPESLDDVTIYRQTRNQLSQLKGALGILESAK